MLCNSLRDRLRPWLRDYDRLQSFAVILIYIQIGFSVRLSSSLLWIQIYRLGISYMETSVPREADYDLRNSFLSPATPVVVRQPSGSDDMIGGSIYDPTYYSSLFEDGQDSKCLSGISHFGNGDNGSTSGPDVSRSKLSRHFQVADDEYADGHQQTV